MTFQKYLSTLVRRHNERSKVNTAQKKDKGPASFFCR